MAFFIRIVWITSSSHKTSQISMFCTFTVFWESSAQGRVLRQSGCLEFVSFPKMWTKDWYNTNTNTKARRNTVGQFSQWKRGTKETAWWPAAHWKMGRLSSRSQGNNWLMVNDRTGTVIILQLKYSHIDKHKYKGAAPTNTNRNTKLYSSNTNLMYIVLWKLIWYCA